MATRRSRRSAITHASNASIRPDPSATGSTYSQRGNQASLGSVAGSTSTMSDLLASRFAASVARLVAITM
ncbi:hypothetical protein DEH84_14105 [Aquabacterium olei]|uniref:Uncharacterized protein n=1 Tax=Aquabacterium olei TaxID=1296669 RepID=A0A2U8FUG6_9BURK|nr:hypothetical protein DEH84_14105 [Aquabacterium olei]